MKFKMNMSPDVLKKRMDLAMDLPYHKFLGLKLLKSEAGVAELELLPSENSINAGGVVHGGIIYSLLDSAAYVAMLPLLHDNQNGVTHDIHVSVMRAAPIDKPIIFRGEIRKTGKRLVFCDSEAWCDNKLIATGHLTKSIINF